ncbi:MAG: hypothetical protein HFG49_04680 [Lachnospiraceae bacterium]|jgi:hypothetical protein|nr:hypothetical protein [Lachnospiraceae bacterium]
MSYTIYVRMKKVGKQKKEELDPVSFELEKKPDTVKELITALVASGVRDYNERKAKGEIIQYLTREEIATQAEAGKISFGDLRGNDADLKKAIENGIQCFEDGIYRIFAGQEEVTSLEQKFSWAEDTVFTFIRLAMLSGRLW